MPEPSMLPILNAVGPLAGDRRHHASRWSSSVLGGILFLVTLVAWIRAATREIVRAPAEHRAAH